MMTLKIRSSVRDYVAQIEETPAFLRDLAQLQPACYVIDETVWQLYGDTLLQVVPESRIIRLPIHEEQKSLASVQMLYDKILGLQAKRNLTMVSIGGGITQDITGFTASTLYRGINWIFVPTTLLAMCDSCVGSKTSLNYGDYKNLIGTFYPPARIHIYAPFAATLSELDFYSGLGEVIKLGIMGGEDTVHELLACLPEIRNRDLDSLKQAIASSLEVKLRYMVGDEFDHGRRRFLNYGHDFGHALESTSHFAVPHGQAVIVGILAANLIACERGRLSAGIEYRLAKDVLLPCLMAKIPAEALNANHLVEAMQKDKKRTGAALALILMRDNYEFELVNDLSSEEVRWALEKLQTYLSPA